MCNIKLMVSFKSIPIMMMTFSLRVLLGLSKVFEMNASSFSNTFQNERFLY